MGNRSGRAPMSGYEDPNFYPYGAGYGNRAPSGLAGYGPAGYMTTPGGLLEEPWSATDWTEYYVPTVGGRQKRPVIYIAAPLPAANPCAGFGGFSGGLPPMGGGFGASLPPMGGGFGASLPPMGGGFGASLPPMGGGFGGFGASLPPMGGGFGASLPPMGGGFGASLPPMGGGFSSGFPMTGACGAGANLGYQVLPMMTVAYGGGIPGVGGGISPYGGGLPLF